MKFSQIVEMIIDNLEGGYYHPDMLQDGRVTDSRYAISGETMFGIDRRNGGSINTSAAGIKFWRMMDAANARKNWKWNYKGGALAPELKKLVSEMMQPRFESYFQRYLSSKSQRIVKMDKRLLFHFTYAVWNGVVWFQRFATDFNRATESGTVNFNKLYQTALNSRLNSSNSLIKQGGNKIQKLFDEYRNYKLLFGILLGGTFLTGGVYATRYILKHSKK